MEILIFLSDHKLLTGAIILATMITVGWFRGSIKPKGDVEE